MSLYADEELDLYAAPGAQPGAAAGPTDPIAALSEAMAAETESRAQADMLVAAGERFEEHPDKLPELMPKLLEWVVDGGDSLIRAWTLDMLALTIGRSSLRAEVKLEVAQKSLEQLARLLNTNSTATIRAVIPIFSTVYPMVFRHLAIAGAEATELAKIIHACKARILSFVQNPPTQPQSRGIQAVAWKFVQKVLLTGTRPTGLDPRLQARSNDVSISVILPGSPLNAPELEREAQELRHLLLDRLYSLSDPAILHPIINIIPTLVKQRPALGHDIIPAMTQWTPDAMEKARSPPMHVRSVEKTMRNVMVHLVKQPSLVGFSAQLHDALQRQKGRMEQAWAADSEERRERRQRMRNMNKHTLDEAEPSSAGPTKRARLDGIEVRPGTCDGRGTVSVDVSQFELEAVVDAVMAGLSAVSHEQLALACENARQAILNDAPDAVHVLAPALFKDEVKTELDEIINPLEMDLDDEELLMEPAEPELEEPVIIADFNLPPAEPLPADDKEAIVDFAVRRIWDGGADLSRLGDLKISDGPRSAVQPKEMWMLLLARLSSRGGEDKRRLIAEFVSKDFGSRSKFATVWLNEEWLAKRRGEQNQYEEGLMAIMGAYIPTLDAKDSSLSQFLLGLPELPVAAIDALEPLCEDSERMIVGFLSLRELAEARPPIRARTLNTLLQFCTHPERKVRVMAITTVRRWVPNSAMSQAVIDYALGILRRLTLKSEIDPSVDEEGETKEDVDMKPDVEAIADESNAGDHIAESKYLTSVSTENVSQYVELAFALSRRDQDLLDNIFSIYPKIASPKIQDIVEQMLTPLIRSLGPTKKLLNILRNFPVGADTLALRVVTTLSASGSAPVLVGVIRSLLAERELDPRFVIPVIAELDKSEIEAQIPRIVSLLSGDKAREGEAGRTSFDVVRSAFAAALQKMTPADLLVCLHGEGAGVKATVDAIGICMSMTSVFRSDVLAAAMQRIVDSPQPLPVCFVRTVFQALKMYKSLVPVVANKVLPKLVVRKVWDVPQLWEGVVPLVRILGREGFGALLQMPLERIQEVVEKQPTLKAPLKAFLANKPSARRQLAGILDDVPVASAAATA